MDPRHSAQDVLRCDLCETPVPPMYCDICHIKLCIPCVGVHLSDQTKDHKVVPIEKQGSTTKCQKHSTKICELHCDQCNIPICALCVSSKEHRAHEVVDIFESMKTKKEAIQRDLQELENTSYPKYQTVASNIPTLKTEARKHTQKLKTDLKKQGDTLHKEIDTIIQKMQSEIDVMDAEHLAVIDKQEKAINHAITEIEQTIQNLKKLLDTSNFCLVSEYKSRNEEFRRVPAQFQVTLPTFTPQDINTENIHQQIGSLSKLVITTEEHCSPLNNPGTESFPPARLLIDEPKIITNINLNLGMHNRFCNLSCLSDSELWTRDWSNAINLYNLQGKLLKSVLTESGHMPWGIAVTRSRDLLYTDNYRKSIYIVKNTHILPLVSFQKWTPLFLCSTSSGDFLATMFSDDKQILKVVRYSGSTEIQSIRCDDNGHPLYSPNAHPKYLIENSNLDICVSDYHAGAVVVVNAAGKLRFRYTGPPSPIRIFFQPWGIATDSQGRILTTDQVNSYIHILDEDGRFLRYIDNCMLYKPEGLCVDSSDNLLVAVFNGVKKIQYLK